MLKRSIAMLLCLCFAIGFFASCSFVEELIPDFLIPESADPYHEIHHTVTVSITDGEHYTVVSENPIRVGRGCDVTFDIEFEEGYEYSSNTLGADFADGKLTLRDLRYPATIKLFTTKKQEIIEIPDDPIEDDDEAVVVLPTPIPMEPEDDTIVPDDKDDPLPELPDTPDEFPDLEFETVVLSAEEKEGYQFICWTADMPLTEGGEIFSQVASGKFTIPTASLPIANYRDESQHVIMYRTNGGTTADGKSYYYQTFSNQVYSMPNTLMHGSFQRKGYALMRYSEEPNGTGENTPLGGKIEVNENGFTELWLNWEKCTSANDFTFESFVNSSGETVLAITAYNADAEKVIIPDYISTTSATYKIEKICAEAFAGKSLQKLYIPPTVSEIENDAFLGCASLGEVTIHDNVWQVSDKSFRDSASIRTVYLNAARAPVFAGSGEGMFCLKYEKLRLTDKKKIVVMSGSSSLYGFYAQDAEEAFNDEYAFVNYGTNAGANSLFYMAATLRFFGEGDIMIHAPEFGSGTQMGGNNFTEKVFRACESTYEMFSYVDMREFTGFFDMLSSFNRTLREGVAEQYYEKTSTFINSYTDMTTNVDNPSYVSTTTSPVGYISLSRINTEHLARMNIMCTRLRERGAEMYFTFAPFNLSVCKPETSDPENQAAVVARLEEVLIYDVISKPSDYLFTQEHFNNSDHHLGITAGKVRTQRLIADIKKQLEDEGVWPK